ncbi:LamG domain-containing protein [bacterium]|nr:LamG domain-containing protein [bacterium]
MTRQSTRQLGFALLILGTSPQLHGQLIHRYSFNSSAGDATGATLVDSIGGADGTVRGTGAFFTGTGLDLPGGASATQAYGDLPNGLISSNTAVTLEGWVTIDTTDQAWARIFDFGSSALGEVTGPGGGGNGTDYLFLSATINADYNAQRVEVRNEDPAGGGIFTFDSAAGTVAGNTIHFAVTWEDTGVGTSKLNYWRDGVRMTTDAIVNANLADLNDVNNWLGRSNWTADANINATFDEFRIYDIALVEQQVTSSMNSGPETPLDFDSDGDGDGMPDAFENLYAFLDSADSSDAALDEDNDGLTNLEEFQEDTIPDDEDSDDDGLTDGEEVNTHGTNPNKTDSDDDGLSDGEEVNTTNTLPLNEDTDDDGITDGYESQYVFLDPNTPGDASLDEDSDTLSNLQEFQVGTAPDDDDTDDDGLSDGEEVNTTNTLPLDADSDDDGLSDGDEVNTTNTLPLDADSDDDGINDGPEVFAGTDPLQSEATTPTPVHRYSFNEAAGAADQGASVIDSIGGANGVIVGNGGLWTGSALTLPGGDGATANAAYVDLPNGLLSAHDHVTFEAWYTVNSVQNWGRIWDFGSTAAGEVNTTGVGASEGLDYFIHASSRGTDFNLQRTSIRNNDADSLGGGIGPIDAAEEAADSGVASVTGQEYHVAGIWTSDGTGGGQLTIYRDGVKQTSRTTTFTPRDINDVNNWLGRSNWTGDNYLNGDLNEFRIYEGAMNDAAVQASFVAGPDAAIGSSGITITSVRYNEVSDQITLTFNSTPGRTYDVFWSSDLLDFSNELIDGIPATGTSTTVGPLANPSPGATKLFFRVND